MSLDVYCFQVWAWVVTEWHSYHDKHFLGTAGEEVRLKFPASYLLLLLFAAGVYGDDFANLTIQNL